MIYLLEFVKGILISFGIITGFLICLAYIIRKTKKEVEYEAETLIKPFEKYLKNLRENEQYEQIKEVETIIYDLKLGNVPDEIRWFKIKRDVSISLNDEDGNTSFRAISNYIVVKRIENEEA